MRDRQDQLLQSLLPQYAPNPGMKNRLLGKLGFEGEALSLDHLPETSKYANHLSWLVVLKPLLPAVIDQIFMQEINRNEHLMQLLVVSNVDVPEEIHEEE